MIKKLICQQLHSAYLPLTALVKSAIKQSKANRAEIIILCSILCKFIGKSTNDIRAS